MEVTLRDALEDAAKALAAVHHSARLDAEVLLAFVLGKLRHHAYTFPKQVLASAPHRQYRSLIERRRAGEPVAYLTGEREFWSLSLAVTPATLIPRPESERLVELALDLISPEERLWIADLGTGSGAIALAIASERAKCVVVATDASEPALEIARQNAMRHHLKQIEFRHGHWCDAFHGDSFDLVLSNPPYVRNTDPHLATGDVRFEPSNALLGGEDGLESIRVICKSVLGYLKPGGYLLIEHGAEQKNDVHGLMRANNYDPVCCFQDYAGLDRVTRGRMAKP